MENDAGIIFFSQPAINSFVKEKARYPPCLYHAHIYNQQSTATAFNKPGILVLKLNT